MARAEFRLGMSRNNPPKKIVKKSITKTNGGKNTGKTGKKNLRTCENCSGCGFVKKGKGKDKAGRTKRKNGGPTNRHLPRNNHFPYFFAYIMERAQKSKIKERSCCIMKRAACCWNQLTPIQKDHFAQNLKPNYVKNRWAPPPPPQPPPPPPNPVASGSRGEDKSGKPPQPPSGPSASGSRGEDKSGKSPPISGPVAGSLSYSMYCPRHYYPKLVPGKRIR